MDEHLQALVLTQVEVGVLVDALRLTLSQVAHRQTEGLLVVLDELRLRGVSGTVDARRQGIGHGLAVGILLDVDGTHHHRSRLGTGSRLQTLLVLAPFAAHQVERAEAQHDRFLETGEVHTYETDGGEVVDSADLVPAFSQRDAELVPADGGGVAVAQLHPTVAAVGDVAVGQGAVVVSLQDVVADMYLVLEVALILVERIVLVDILHVGTRLVRRVVRLRAVVGVGGVALRVVDALIAVEDTGLGVVEVGAAVVVVVVTGRVAAPGLQQRVVLHYGTNLVEPLLIGSVGALLVIGKTVQTHILQGAAAGGGGKGVGLRGLLGNLAPMCIGEGLRAVDGHAALIELLAVAQNILADLAKIDVQVAGILRRCAGLPLIDKGVHQPELHIFYISLLEVGGLQLAHHAAPLLRGIRQRTVGIVLRRQVVGAALLGIVGQVQHRQRRGGTVVCRLVAVGVQLLDIDLADAVVAELLEVALDMTRREARRTAGEQRVDSVPRQQGTVVARGDAGLVVSVGHLRRHTRQHPRFRVDDGNQVLRILEVVEIGGIVLRTTGSPGNELGKLAGELYLRRLRDVEEGHFVQHVSKPLRLLLPAHVQAPDGIVQRFLAHRHLRRQGLFRQVHQRTAEDEVLREVVLPVHAVHRLALHAVFGVRLQRHVDVRAGIDDALVEDGHLAGRIVYRVVGTFLQGDATGRHHYRTLRHVIGTEGDDVGTRAFVLSHQHELVFLSRLLGNGLRRVVELVEDVLVGDSRQTCCLELGPQVVAEGLCRGQEDTAVLHGVALHEVELSVGMSLHIIIQTVTAQELQQGRTLDGLLGQVGQVDAGGVALVLDVETEFLFLDAGGQVVDVLHHQVPVALCRTVRRVLQRLDEERLPRVGDVAGKLAHLERASAVGVFEGDSQHLVGLQAGLEGDEAQGLIHRVLRRRQQTGRR